MQGGTYRTVGARITKRSMTCPLPRQTLQVHDRHLDFEAIRPADSKFSSLPLGGARQIYTLSVSNNGRDFGSSKTYTVYNSTCMTCSSSDVVQRVCFCLHYLCHVVSGIAEVPSDMGGATVLTMCIML